MSVETFIENIRTSYISFSNRIINNRKIGKFDIKENNLLSLATCYLEIIEGFFVDYDRITNFCFFKRNNNYYDIVYIKDVVNHFNRITGCRHNVNDILLSGIGYMVVEKDFIVN